MPSYAGQHFPLFLASDKGGNPRRLDRAVPPSLGGAAWDDTIAHGSALVAGHVGPWSLQGVAKGFESLDSVSVPVRGYWRTDTPDEWSPTGTYSYNNTASNKGGVVPGGGLTIDGYTVPAGTRVVQFRNFSAGDFYVTSGQDVLFRGCRFRSAQKGPGYFNCVAGQTSKVWLGFNDLGAANANTDAAYNEIPIAIAAAGGGAIWRNYITWTTTGIAVNANGFDVTENLISKLVLWYGETGPPGESGPKHLNGFTTNGGMTCIRLLRNNITLPDPDDLGYAIQQTDAISFFQDFGVFPGTGTNSDATTGYQVIDNYVGGGGYTIYAGKNGGSASDSVKNMVLTGNRWTTQWHSGSGFYGPITATPTWGSLGNVQSDNRWADGPSAGQVVI